METDGVATSITCRDGCPRVPPAMASRAAFSRAGSGSPAADGRGKPMAQYPAFSVAEPASDPCSRQTAPCPVCGFHECFCRPTFNAGQILSAETLNRTMGYLTAKRRLTNRSMFGWGVVCGLEVACAPCGSDSVSVSPGYALSPCGDDIVVCAADTVPVCKLIRDCRQQERRYVVCEPYQAGDDCMAGEEEWVLAIRYQEMP